MKNICPILYCQPDPDWNEKIRQFAGSNETIGLLAFSFSHDNEDLMNIANELGFSICYRNRFTVATLEKK